MEDAQDVYSLLFLAGDQTTIADRVEVGDPHDYRAPRGYRKGRYTS